jgi:hypothetical protein
MINVVIAISMALAAISVGGIILVLILIAAGKIEV